MIRSAALSIAAVLALLVACQPKPAECPPTIVEVTGDAGVIVRDETTVIVTDPDGGITEYVEPFDRTGGYLFPACNNACTNMVRLGCNEARARPGEDSCYVVCKRAEGTGGRIDFKPSCLAAARSKTAVRACGTYRCS